MLTLKESYEYDTVGLEYEFETEVMTDSGGWYSNGDPREPDYETVYFNYVYEANVSDVLDVLYLYLNEKDIPNYNNMSEEEIDKYVDDHFDELLDKYYDEVLSHFEDRAYEDAMDKGYPYD